MHMTMTRLIRLLIKESVMELREGFVDDVLGGVSRSMENDDSLNTLQGREYEANLRNDIPELRDYALVDYLPLNAKKERWTFDVETSRGLLNTIAITHILGETSYWKFVFGVAEQSMERMTPTVGYKTDLMGYSDMIEKVNSDWQQWG